MQNNFEISLKKYPFNGKSKYLFDKIMIIGYTQSFMSKNTPSDNIIRASIAIDLNNTNRSIQDKDENNNNSSIKKQMTISPNLKSKQRKQIKSLKQREAQLNKKIELPEYPIVLGEISSDYSKQYITDETIISLIFPSLPKISKTNSGEENKDENVIFSFTPTIENSKISTNGYGFIYYEIFKGYSYPKVIFFLSEYPYFSSFKNLGINISQSIHSIYPLEYILHNIINYTPSPINFSVKLQAFFNNATPIVFPQLTCYPLFNFDLSELFNVLPYEMIVEIFFFSLLENDIIFFSNNNEILTIIMYIFANLSFPCNESTYYWQILSVSRSTFLNDASSFVSKTCSCMIGINERYDASIPTTSKIKEHFIVDIDEKVFEYKYNEDRVDPNEVAKTKRLHDYIKRAIKDKCTQDDKLAQAILLLYKDLKVIGDKITHTNTFNCLGDPCFYKHMNKVIYTHNKTIQNAFYLFMLQILKIYSQNYLLSNVTDRDSNSSNRNKDIFYISINNNLNFKPDELLFYEQFIQTAKYNQFMINFIEHQDSIDLFKIPLIITEELIYWLGIKKNIKSILCLDIMDKLYLNHKSIEVDFKAFYQEFTEKKMKLLLSIQETSKRKVRNKPLDLNVKNIFQYNYLLSNMGSKERELLFPSLLMCNANTVQTITFHEIQNEIEAKLIEQNGIRFKHLIFNCIILVFGLTREICESSGLIQIHWFKIGFSTVKINMRKYYSMLLIICLRLAKEKSDFSMKQCYLIINSLRDNLHLIPNEELLRLMNQIGSDVANAFPNDSDYTETKEYILEQEIVSTKVSITSSNQNTVIRNIIESAEVRNWDKNIRISFQDKEIKPYLNIKFNKSNDQLINSSKVYSIKKLYNKTYEIMCDYYQSLDFNKINKKRLNDILLNLLFYIQNIKFNSNEQKTNLMQLLLNILLYVNFREDKKMMDVSLFTLQITLSEY